MQLVVVYDWQGAAPEAGKVGLGYRFSIGLVEYGTWGSRMQLDSLLGVTPG